MFEPLNLCDSRWNRFDDTWTSRGEVAEFNQDKFVRNLKIFKLLKKIWKVLQLRKFNSKFVENDENYVNFLTFLIHFVETLKIWIFKSIKMSFFLFFRILIWPNRKLFLIHFEKVHERWRINVTVLNLDFMLIELENFTLFSF